MPSLAERVAALGSDIYLALEKLTVPVVVIDGAGVLVYGNDAATTRFGELQGRLFTSFLAPESLPLARDSFARKMLGVEQASELKLTLIDKDGRRVPAEVTAVALEKEGHVVGVFGLVDVRDVERPVAPSPEVRLTPRQTEVLRHLAAGCTTEQMSELMGIEVHTVRNHVRDLLRRLRAHSRLEAVVRAQELGLTAG
jgi:PAS domain S-box-containing protein